MLLTARIGDDVATDVLSWPRSGHREATAQLRMRPLSLGAIHALVSRRLGRSLPRPVMVRIHEISGGNPFFALELARAAGESGPQALTYLPDSLAGLVRDRLARLPEEARDVLLAAACLVRPTTELLAAVTEAHRGTPRPVGRRRRRRGRVQQRQPGGLRPPLLARAVYTEATPTQRRGMHRRLAAIVEQPELRARHLALAAVSPDPETLAALDVAAGAAAARGAPSTAAELIELAIGLGGDTPARRLRAADQHFRAGAMRPPNTIWTPSRAPRAPVSCDR